MDVLMGESFLILWSSRLRWALVLARAFMEHFHSHQTIAPPPDRAELILARQVLTVLQTTARLALGADIEISEEDRTIFMLTHGDTTQINLSIKYIQIG